MDSRTLSDARLQGQTALVTGESQSRARASWWPAPRKLGSRVHKAMAKAPGTYVMAS